MQNAKAVVLCTEKTLLEYVGVVVICHLVYHRLRIKGYGVNR